MIFGERKGDDKARYEKQCAAMKEYYVAVGIGAGCPPSQVREAVDIAHHATEQGQFKMRDTISALPDSPSSLQVSAAFIAFAMMEQAMQDAQAQIKRVMGVI